MCVYDSGSKDSGAYDLGELDQAFFLYLDGQADPSSVQDQRRELSLRNTHTWKFLFAFNLQIQKDGLFPSRPLFVRLGDSLCLVTHQKHVWLIRICSSFVLPLTRSLHRREGQKNGVDVSVSKKEKENENFLSLHLFIFL